MFGLRFYDFGHLISMLEQLFSFIQQPSHYNKNYRISLTQGKIEVFIHFSINTRALSSLLPALNVILYVLTKRLFCYILPRSSIIVQIFAIVLKLTSANIFHFMVKIVYSHVHLS